jgi:hypothetical protein
MHSALPPGRVPRRSLLVATVALLALAPGRLAAEPALENPPASPPAPASSRAPTPRPVDSRITRVTVFRDVAQVTRTAVLDLPAGDHVLVFTDLPLRTQVDALDCRVQGQARATGIRIEAKNQTQPSAERIKTLEAKASELDHEFGALGVELRVLDEKREFLTGVRTEAPKALAAPASGGASGATALRATFAFLGDEWLAIEKARLEIEARQTAVARRRDQVRGELNALRTPGTERRHEAQVELAVQAPGRVQIELGYLVAGAAWRPYHDARLDREHETVDWASYAEIRQTSGEDWSQVELTVSTSDPNAGKTIPTLSPILLGAPPNLDGVGEIRGLLSDSRTGQPLSYANVVVLGTKLGAISQEDGSYVIRNVPPGTHEVQASYVGYASLGQHLGVSAGSQARADFVLDQERFTEKEILVKAQTLMVTKERADTHHSISSETPRQLPADDEAEAIALKAGVVAQGGELHLRGWRGSEVVTGGFEAEYGNVQSGSLPVLSAKLDETAIGAVFRMERPESIPADGSWHRATISSRTLPVTLEIVTVPRRDRAAYLQARGLNSTGGPLLAGPVHLFSDQDYLGKADLADSVSPGEALRLSFGRHERIEVVRVLVKEERRTSRRNSELAYQYRITVRNFDQKPQQVLVLDQVPVSLDERVQVELWKVAPEPVDGIQDPRGQLRWSLPVAPGGEAGIDLAYTVRCPREFGLAGL